MIVLIGISHSYLYIYKCCNWSAIFYDVLGYFVMFFCLIVKQAYLYIGYFEDVHKRAISAEICNVAHIFGDK